MDAYLGFMSRFAPPVLRVLLVLILGFWGAKVAARATQKALGKRLSLQGAMLAAKGVRYGILVVLALTLLSMFNVGLTALLGAAGVMGIAIGFAAQTSLSNLISGLFLVFERPFQIGDVLQVDDVLGIVQNIDLLSVSLRTFDNRFVRIPNESLIRNRFINITRHSIRRLDIDVGVAYKEDIEHVTRVLSEIADENPNSLDEPAPIILFKGFGQSSLDFMLGVWFEKADMLVLRNSILREIKRRFDAEGIEIPFPHHSLYTGSMTEPFPIRLVDGQVPAKPADRQA